MSVLGKIESHLPPRVRKAAVPVAAFLLQSRLDLLAKLFGTDKWGKHWYTQHYQRYFRPWKNRRFNLLEIGIGGYADATDGGASLRMWKAFFPKAKIVGLDLCDKRHFAQPRIDIHVGDQTDATLLRSLSDQYGGFDIIVDDGSHVSEHIISTFQILFPLLRSPGIYAIEDTQTSYWPGFGGGMQSPHTSTEFFKSLTDGLNHVEYPIENYAPTYFDRNIVEIAFFHNLIIVRKGNYDETTNDRELLLREMAAARNASLSAS